VILLSLSLPRSWDYKVVAPCHLALLFYVGVVCLRLALMVPYISLRTIKIKSIYKNSVKNNDHVSQYVLTCPRMGHFTTDISGSLAFSDALLVSSVSPPSLTLALPLAFILNHKVKYNIPMCLRQSPSCFVWKMMAAYRFSLPF
jgi:hypothetical protein